MIVNPDKFQANIVDKKLKMKGYYPLIITNYQQSNY